MLPNCLLKPPLARRRERTRQRIVVLASLVAQCIAASANAYWELSPRVESGISYSTNPRYVASNAPDTQLNDDATATFIDLDLTATAATPDDEIRLSPRYRQTRFLKGNQDLNENNWYVDLAGSHKAGRGGVGLSAEYSDVGIVTAQFESATPIDPDGNPNPGTGTGRILDTNVTQKSVYVAPYLSYTFSTLNSFRLDASVSDTTFDESRSQSLLNNNFDYKNGSVSATITHILNPKNSLLLAMNSGVFKSDAQNGPARNDTNSYGVTFEYQRAISQTLTGSLMVGTSRSTVDVTSGLPVDPLTGLPCFENSVRVGCSGSSDSQNFVGDLSLRKRSERTTLNLDVGRQESPSSNGYTVIQDSLRFFVDQSLTSRLSGSFGVVYYQQSAVGFNSQDTDYFTTDVGIRYSLTPEWSVGTRYGYIKNKTTPRNANFSSTTEENNQVYFNVTYQGVGIRR